MMIIHVDLLSPVTFIQISEIYFFAGPTSCIVGKSGMGPGIAHVL